MRFEFATATRIVFGAGAIRDVGKFARNLGRHAFVVTGGQPARAEPLLDLLAAEDVAATTFAHPGEPDITTVAAATARAREAGCDLVIGFGGGSPIDSAKAVSALLTNPGDVLDYLEVVGRGRPLGKTALPCIAIPTTAGTGAEVTRNAVLASPGDRVKVSLRSPLMLPRLAVVDPELTHGLPPRLTGTTGLDALTQLIEPYVSCRANPMIDGFCAEGIRRVARSLRPAYHRGDAAAREDMALASLLGGFALANAGLGAVHGFAGPIGGAFPAPHGAICAALLPAVMEANLRAAELRQPDGALSRRYGDVAQWLTGDATASAAAGVRWVRALIGELEIPSLGAYGITADDIPSLVARAGEASSMKGNPLRLSADELAGILRRSL